MNVLVNGVNIMLDHENLDVYKVSIEFTESKSRCNNRAAMS